MLSAQYLVEFMAYYSMMGSNVKRLSVHSLEHYSRECQTPFFYQKVAYAGIISHCL